MASDNFDIDNYVKVNERLSEFRINYPDGYITTFRTPVEGGVSFKTIICRNKDEANLYGLTSIAPSTGHSFLGDEEEGEKVEEYAETVAIGRALAILGFKVEKSIASTEEMEKFKAKQEAKPVSSVKKETKEEGPAPTSKLQSSRNFKKSSRFKK